MIKIALIVTENTVGVQRKLARESSGGEDADRPKPCTRRHGAVQERSGDDDAAEAQEHRELCGSGVRAGQDVHGERVPAAGFIAIGDHARVQVFQVASCQDRFGHCERDELLAQLWNPPSRLEA
jgi:hypothetical protein